MDEPWKYYAKLKLDTHTENMLYDSISSCTILHGIVLFKRVNFMVYELNLNKTIKKYEKYQSLGSL